MAIEEKLSMAIVPTSWLDNVMDKLEAVESLIMDKKEDDFGKQWIESPKARQMLGVSSKTWQEYRNNRVIPFSQFGRKIYVKRQDLEDFMEANYIQAKK